MKAAKPLSIWTILLFPLLFSAIAPYLPLTPPSLSVNFFPGQNGLSPLFCHLAPYFSTFPPPSLSLFPPFFSPLLSAGALLAGSQASALELDGGWRRRAVEGHRWPTAFPGSAPLHPAAPERAPPL